MNFSVGERESAFCEFTLQGPQNMTEAGMTTRS